MENVERFDYVQRRETPRLADPAAAQNRSDNSATADIIIGFGYATGGERRGEGGVQGLKDYLQ